MTNPQTISEQTKKSAPERKPRPAVAASELGVAALDLQAALGNLQTARPETILRLQRMAGNRAVTGLLQRKVVVGPAHDHYEQEADRVAQQVMTMPAFAAPGQPALIRITPRGLAIGYWLGGRACTAGRLDESQDGDKQHGGCGASSVGVRPTCHAFSSFSSVSEMRRVRVAPSIATWTALRSASSLTGLRRYVVAPAAIARS